MIIQIAVYNGDTMDTHYPFVAYTIDAFGDTIHSGNINWFVTFAADTSLYNYVLVDSTFPTYPLSIYFVYSNFTSPNAGEDTCILYYHPSCDSVITTFNLIDSSSTPHVISINIETMGLSNGSFGYGGFVLLDELGDTIADENFNIAGNVYGPISYNIETRILELTQNIAVPFYGSLHLINGWFAGNPNTSCIFPFNINTSTTEINEIIEQKTLLKITDLFGRKTKKNNQPLFYIYDDGTVEKIMILKKY